MVPNEQSISTELRTMYEIPILSNLKKETYLESTEDHIEKLKDENRLKPKFISF